jgi:hypothetical protein
MHTTMYRYDYSSLTKLWEQVGEATWMKWKYCNRECAADVDEDPRASSGRVEA